MRFSFHTENTNGISSCLSNCFPYITFHCCSCNYILLRRHPCKKRPSPQISSFVTHRWQSNEIERNTLFEPETDAALRSVFLPTPNCTDRLLSPSPYQAAAFWYIYHRRPQAPTNKPRQHSNSSCDSGFVIHHAVLVAITRPVVAAWTPRWYQGQRR